MVQAIAKILEVTDSEEIKEINKTVSPLLLNSVVATGNLALLQQLKLDGADFSLSDYRGRGPIHVGITIGHIEIVKFLLECNINLDATDLMGVSPLYLACI